MSLHAAHAARDVRVFAGVAMRRADKHPTAPREMVSEALAIVAPVACHISTGLAHW